VGENTFLMLHTLYHYCPEDAFWAIIKGRCIRLSSVLRSTDSSEGLLLKNLLSELLQSDFQNCKKEEFIREWMTQIREIRTGRAFCLTTERDLLSQWCRYADDGRGFSISFSHQYLNYLPHTELKHVEYEHDEHVKSARGLYEKLKEPARPIAYDGQIIHAAGLDRWDPQHKESKDALGRGNADDLIQERLRRNIEQALWNAGIFWIKHNGFREEREVRLLDNGVFPKKDTFRDIEMELDQNPILEVMIGPRSSKCEDSIRQELGTYGFRDVQFSKSDIPYRERTSMTIVRGTTHE
jgi:hypothetical protein